MQRQISLDGWELTYEFSRKRVKNLNLRVRGDGSVAVSAPQRMPLEQVEEFLRKKQDFLRRAVEKTERPPALLSAEDKERCCRKAAELLQRIYPAFAVYGVPEPTLRFREMRSRWGSCIPSKRVITINTRLALCPEECLEYILIHELCHFLQADHSAKFYAWMDHILPNWREVRKQLRTYE